MSNQIFHKCKISHQDIPNSIGAIKDDMILRTATADYFLGEPIEFWVGLKECLNTHQGITANIANQIKSMQTENKKLQHELQQTKTQLAALRFHRNKKRARLCE